MQQGDILAHFEIQEKIGAGGMGAVYRATDKNLSRDVALKILPPAFAQDTERLGRFQREAQALAALQHPNIASIYGIERAEGHTFLVMELCEGEDLSTLIDRGALPISEAREIAIQIARGLEEAHEKGIIHRDLKPANVRVSSEGKVKVLDFGLARTLDEETPATEISGETLTAGIAMTQPGVVLGTAAYMSPEQARGKTIDKRTDIWAFGVILYEMLTGRRLFAGETVSDILASVLRKDLPFEGLPEDLPLEMGYVVRRCLDRNKESRLRDIGEARCLVSDDASGSSLSLLALPAKASALTGPQRRRWLWPMLTALAVATLLVVQVPRFLASAPEAGASALRYIQLTAQGNREAEGAMAPGGLFFVYTAAEGENSDIFLQRAEGLKPINLTSDSPTSDYQPVISPDGKQIAFVSNREGDGVYVMGATGESARLLVSGGAWPAWSPAGDEIVYCTENYSAPWARQGTSELWIVGVDGQNNRRIPLDIDAIQPHWSPGGQRIAFWSVKADGGQRDLWSVRPDGTDLIQLTDDSPLDFCPVWAHDGRWLYFLSNRGGLSNVWRVRVDEDTGITQGDPELFTVPSPDVRHFSLAPDGSGLLYTARREAQHLHRVDFDSGTMEMKGRPRPILEGSMVLENFAVSADGQWIAFQRRGLKEDLYLIRSDGTGLRKLTDDEDRDRGPFWYDDDKRLIFYSDRGGKYDLWSIRPDGADLHQVSDLEHSVWYPKVHPTENLITGISSGGTYRMEWSADGRQVGESQVWDFGLPAGMQFYGRFWSPDGQRLLGWKASATNAMDPVVAVYDHRDGSLTDIFSQEEPWPILFWGPRGKSVFVLVEEGVLLVDTQSGSERLFLSEADFPGVAEVHFDAANEVMFLVTGTLESDLWLVEMEP